MTDTFVSAPPAVIDEHGSFLAMIERAAHDPTIDIDKLDRLLVMRERENARVAEREFSQALSLVQAELAPVGYDSANPQTRSRYASYAALDRATRPIYTRHGFGLTFNTETIRELEVRVVCKARHAGGHVEIYQIDMPADGKGARGNDVMTRTHAVGSGVSYGMRYLLKLIFNLATENDDDGNAAGRTVRRPAQPAPNVMQGHDAETGEVKSKTPITDAAWAENDRDASKAAYIQEIDHRIDTEEDYFELGMWWNSPDQKKARKDLLTDGERAAFMNKVSNKLGKLQNAQTQEMR